MPLPAAAALRQEMDAVSGGGSHHHPRPSHPNTNHHLPWYARLDVFRFCRFLRLLGSVMGLVVLFLFGVSWWAICVSVYGPIVRGAGPRGQSATPGGRAAAAFLIAAFSGLCAMALWSYFAAVGTEPGRVPSGWHPFEDDAAAEMELRRLGVTAAAEDADCGDGGIGGGSLDAALPLPPDVGQDPSPFHHNHPGAGPFPFARHPHHHHPRNPPPHHHPHHHVVPYTGDPRDPRRPRFCRKCKAWKPPRSHHCSASSRCVLKMDHYCIWVVNCVGLLNYKAFFLFLVYTFWASFVAAAALVKPAIAFFGSAPLPDASLAVAFVALAMDAAFAVALAAFVGMHANLVRAGCTTIEMYEKERPGRWPYERGSFAANWADVAGPWPAAAAAAVASGGELSAGASAAAPCSSSSSSSSSTSWRARARRAGSVARWLLAPTHTREAERELLEECLGPGWGGGGGSGGGGGGGGGGGAGGVAGSSPGGFSLQDDERRLFLDGGGRDGVV
jgi:hypothetical protein